MIGYTSLEDEEIRHGILGYLVHSCAHVLFNTDQLMIVANPGTMHSYLLVNQGSESTMFVIATTVFLTMICIPV